MAPRSHVKWRCLLLCFMCLRLSVSAFVSLSVSFKCLCVCVCHCPCICLNFCLSIYFDLNLYVHLLLSPFMPLHLSLSPSVFPSLSLSVPLSLLLLCVCLSVCLFLWLLVCVPIDAQHLDIWTEAIMRRWLEVVVASVDGVLPQRLSSLHLRPSSVPWVHRGYNHGIRSRLYARSREIPTPSPQEQWRRMRAGRWIEWRESSVISKIAGPLEEQQTDCLAQSLADRQTDWRMEARAADATNNQSLISSLHGRHESITAKATKITRGQTNNSSRTKKRRSRGTKKKTQRQMQRRKQAKT